MKVLITGSSGTIGHVISNGLANKNEVIGLDLPEYDIKNYEMLVDQMRDVDVVIHTAHSTDELKRESWRSGTIDPANILMERNVFQAVIECGVKRLIIASSVHADDFNNYDGTELMTIPGSYKPASPYGAHKIILEEEGKFYASRGDFEFIAIRLGGVTEDNSVRTILKEPQVWLSHQDLINVIEICVNADPFPNNYAVFYGISNNDDRIHSYDNPFGWVPHDNSKDFMHQ